MTSPTAKMALEDTADDGDDISNLSIHEDEESKGTGSNFESSCTGTNPMMDNEANSAEDAKELRDSIIKDEELAVRKSRLMVGVAVAFCSVAVTVAVYFLTKQSDQTSFELEYEGLVKDIKALVRWEVRYNFALMEQLSASISIAAGYLNSTFPFHTEPQFEISGGFVDGMGGVMSAGFAPFVREEQRTEWGMYSRKNQGWIQESAYLKKVHPVHRDALHGTIQDHEHDRRGRRLQEESPSIARSIWRWENGMKVPEINLPGQLFAPLWQISPADAGVVNVNLLSDPVIAELYLSMLQVGHGVLSYGAEVGDLFDFLFDPEEKHLKKDPHGIMLQPVYEKIVEEENSTLAGVLVGITPYGNLLDRLLPEGKDGVIGVFKDDCGNTMSFELSSTKAYFLGYEDMHEPEFDEFEKSEMNIEMYAKQVEGLCTHDLYLYPSSKFRSNYDSNRPLIYTSLVAMAFLIVIGLFIYYDYAITTRQNRTISAALKTQAIVTSLFPEEVGKRMIHEAQQIDKNIAGKPGAFTKAGLDQPNGTNDNTALAKLYPEATVMFGDLVGFTAWSSMRDPPQVFRLLETIYSKFDQIANRRRVFKVETIGDCYVAVCGVPHERKNHHMVMARFARDCVQALGPLLRKLEVELGPDTADLGLRIGLNSGPVTAGVLRGDRARFQLFGDTVNTAARMESTGARNKIHISKETADLIIRSGHENWVKAREESVLAKGKGVLQCFWLEVKNDTTMSTSSGALSTSSGTDPSSSSLNDGCEDIPDKLADTKSSLDPKTSRLVDWNKDVMVRLLRELVSHRAAAGVSPDTDAKMQEAEKTIQKRGGIVFDELVDIVSLSKYDTETVKCPTSSTPCDIDEVVTDQLREYIACIAGLYQDNAFHGFEHASHVTMSVNKLLSRIIASGKAVLPGEGSITLETPQDNSYGIASDPLLHLAIIFSALVHDVDHSGVPNNVLVKEKAEIATLYRQRSVAEQNSVDVAWKLLMQDSFKDLRRAICCNRTELKRFRELVVVTVMATDIADKELKERRNARWKKAFHQEDSQLSKVDLEEDVDRKATIVIEHIIQASDISHTMQHWHVYRKWNEKLFFEMYHAFKAGRSEADPSSFWYKGEIGFFDYYIIPLAKKLKDCGVFGVSGDEYLHYAEKNRNEWVAKGEQVVQDYLQKLSTSEK